MFETISLIATRPVGFRTLLIFFRSFWRLDGFTRLSTQLLRTTSIMESDINGNPMSLGAMSFLIANNNANAFIEFDAEL